MAQVTNSIRIFLRSSVDFKNFATKHIISVSGQQGIKQRQNPSHYEIATVTNKTLIYSSAVLTAQCFPWGHLNLL